MSAVDNVHTWRDLADQLTPEQIARMERAELTLVPAADGTVDAESHRGTLLFGAREFVEQNIAAERFGHVPMPTGAEQVDAWWPGDSADDSWSRAWWGTSRTIEIVSARNPFTIALTGTQWSDGRVENSVVVYAGDDPVMAGEARQLAAALVAAADELDAWSATAVVAEGGSVAEG